MTSAVHANSPQLTLLPEWAQQEAVILAWPNEHTDWAPWLLDVRNTYVQLITAINDADAVVILLCQENDIALIKSIVPYHAKVLLVPAQYNDTWVRDYAFLSCESPQGNQPVSYTFNGWGQKFDAQLDNKINRDVLAQLCRLPLIEVDLVAEGGALEIDQNQHLISTASCLFNPLRNGDIARSTYQQSFEQYLGASQISIFEHGHLEGDDTDGHIDTLVRFTPLHGIVIQSAFNRPDDPHFAGLRALTQECKQAMPSHSVFELPLPYMLNSEGERLPASYANFLICNDSVLFPVYQQLEDADALEVIQKAFPNHRIVPINCAPLVQQFGSLHCITMQVPQGTLHDDIVQHAKTGVVLL